jgi:hypothetical protein
MNHTPISDRVATALQESGQASMVGTLAEALAAVFVLGIDPRDVVIHGRLSVKDKPAFDDTEAKP